MDKCLLVPTDISSAARDAMPLAGRLARSLDARIVLLHVTVMPSGLDEATLIRPLPHMELVPAGQYVREAFLGELERYADSLRAEGLEVLARVELGDALASVARVAEELRPAVIVLRGEGRARSACGRASTPPT